MSRLYRLSMTVLLILLAGCSTSSLQQETTELHEEGRLPEETVKGRVLLMECNDGYEFPAHVQMNQAWLFLPEGTKRLVPQRSEEGSSYSNSEYTFWYKGDEGSLDVTGQPTLKCRNNRGRAVWEEAKLRGADFRAAGNEPGWYLELSLDGNLVYVGDYGSTRLLFKTPEPEVNRSKRTSTYNVKDRQHNLTVRIEGKECRDTMTGEIFDTTVTVNLDGKKVTGCGRALH